MAFHRRQYILFLLFANAPYIHVSMHLKNLSMKCRHCKGRGYEADPRKVGEFVRKMRIAGKKGLRELAREAGISASHLSDIENGKRNLTESIGQKIGVKLFN